jgi:predicted nucleotidyltransferase
MIRDVRLIPSDLALAELLTLGQADSATLAQLAQILQVQPSSCQRALEILLDDGLVVAFGHGRGRRYSLNGNSAALGPVEQLARVTLPPRDVLRIVGRANQGVEFVGVSKDRIVVVFKKRASEVDRSRALEVIRESARALTRETQFFDHADLRRPGVNAAESRRAIAQGEVLAGDLDRSLPDRDGRRHTAGRVLGRINPEVELPPRRVLRAIGRRHGVGAFRIFGSAVRSDFRSDSDIDLAVVPSGGRRLDRSALDSLEAELESRLGRDVDVVSESDLKPGVRHLLEKEAITL